MKEEWIMLEKVAESVLRLKITLPLRMGDVNCYLFEGKHGYTVVDTGVHTTEAKDAWQEVLNSGLKIEKVVLTHTHQDHIGLARWFQETVGVPIEISDLGYTEMQKFRNLLAGDQFQLLIKAHGAPDNFVRMPIDASIYEFEPDQFYKNKVVLGDETYEAILTPGHAPDQYCFYNQDSKLMVVGDHIIKEFSPVIGLWSGEETNVLGDYYQSLESIKGYETDLALPGHGGLIMNFAERVHQIKERHDERLLEVLNAVKEERKHAYQICKEIYGPQKNVSISSFMAILTRLIYLEGMRKVRRKTEGNVFLFGH